jgi:hypothetical protein
MAERLVARFGGQLLERFVEADAAGSAPEETVTRLTRAVNRGDLDAAAALYGPDATLVGQPGQLAQGRIQIREALRGSSSCGPRWRPWRVRCWRRATSRSTWGAGR